MPYRNRISTLKESQLLIDKLISEFEESADSDPVKLTEMRTKSILYKDELRRLERLQWEHDHETIDYGDDR